MGGAVARDRLGGVDGHLFMLRERAKARSACSLAGVSSSDDMTKTPSLGDLWCLLVLGRVWGDEKGKAAWALWL